MRDARLQLVALEVVTTCAIAGVALAYLQVSDSFLLPEPRRIATSFREAWLFARVPTDLLPSMVRLALGFALGVGFGIFAGVTLGLVPVLRALLGPLINFARSIPPPALIPVTIALLGIGSAGKVSIIAFCCTWPVLLNVQAGVVGMNSVLSETARGYQIRGLARVRFVVLPSVLPRIFAGMRMSLSFAILLLVISEMVASTEGIGYFIMHSAQSFALDDMWAGIVLLGLLGWGLNALLQLAEKRALRWHYR